MLYTNCNNFLMEELEGDLVSTLNEISMSQQKPKDIPKKKLMKYISKHFRISPKNVINVYINRYGNPFLVELKNQNGEIEKYIFSIENKKLTNVKQEYTRLIDTFTWWELEK